MQVIHVGKSDIEHAKGDRVELGASLQRPSMFIEIRHFVSIIDALPQQLHIEH